MINPNALCLQDTEDCPVVTRIVYMALNSVNEEVDLDSCCCLFSIFIYTIYTYMRAPL